jgi:hypothetical protein
MRLRYIYRGDFRKSEHTLFNLVSAEVKDLKLNEGDCVLLLSHSGKLLKFVYGMKELQNGEKTVKILPSQTYRITSGGTWNPLMLKNYASAVGIELQGLKRFEDHYRSLATV